MQFESGRLSTPITPDDHVLGRPDARVTIVEYADFECPHCRAIAPILKALKRKMGDEIGIVFRYFPLTNVHPRAQRAALAAEAAGAQGKFWEMHDLLFEHQDNLEQSDLEDYARQLGLDMDAFLAALDDEETASRVGRDASSGMRSGVNGTPSIFINCERYDGPRDIGSLLGAVHSGHAA